MVNVIGVRFQKNGRMVYFDAGTFTPGLGEYVVVETERGSDLGEVIMCAHHAEEDQLRSPLQHMIRPATEQDIQRATENRAKEAEAYSICQHKIQEHHLDMKLVSVECLFDSGKILFYFTSNGRVDFRALVRDLASVFKTRIELRQIGVRDEARMLGGLGPCGRPICCGAFLNDFQPVSIKMAKEQSLSLNPTKISGVCGRLMCCLKYEQDHYEQTRKKMPRVGREVATPDGIGTVMELNIVKETVSVRITRGDENEIRQYPLEQISRPGPQTAGDRELPAGASQKTQPDPAIEEENQENAPSLADVPEIDTEPSLDPASPETEWKGEMDSDSVKEEAEKEKPLPKKPSRAGERAKGRSGEKNRSEAVTEGAAAETREGKAKDPGKKGNRRLGQPVQRTNAAKNKPEKNPPVDTAPKLSNPTQEKESSVSQPAQKKKKATGWADALQKALQAADSNPGAGE